MRWLAKAAVQTVFGWLPAEHRTNAFLQQHVSRRLPRSDHDFDAHVVWTAPHVEAWERHGDRALADARVYEFGSGYDLIGPASMWAMGAESQLLLDIRPNLVPSLVVDTIARLRARGPILEERLGRSLRPLPGELHNAPVPEVLRALGMRYVAPADARRTGFAPDSVDLVLSTWTLEHIPPAILRAIFAECRRLLSPGGIITAQIDFKDHFSYIDPAVGSFNFYRYDAARWRLVNPSLHYQSRLRWPGYLEIFEAAGLEPIEVHLTRAEGGELEALERMSLAAPFRRLPLETLALREAHVVLAPAERG